MPLQYVFQDSGLGNYAAAGGPTKDDATLILDNAISLMAEAAVAWFVVVPDRDGTMIFDGTYSLAVEGEGQPTITVRVEKASGTVIEAEGSVETAVQSGVEIYVRLSCPLSALMCLATSSIGYTGPWQQGADQKYIAAANYAAIYAHRQSNFPVQTRYYYGGPYEDEFFTDLQGVAFIQLHNGEGYGVGSWLLDQPFPGPFEEYGAAGGVCAWSHARIAAIGSQENYTGTCAVFTEHVNQGAAGDGGIGWTWAQGGTLLFDYLHWYVSVSASERRISVTRIEKTLGPFAGQESPTAANATVEWDSDRCEMLTLRLSPAEPKPQYYEDFPDEPKPDPDQSVRWYYKAVDGDGFEDAGTYGPTRLPDGTLAWRGGIAGGPNAFVSDMTILGGDYQGGLAPFTNVTGILDQARAAEAADRDVAYRGGIQLFGCTPDMLNANAPGKMAQRFDTVQADGRQSQVGRRYDQAIEAELLVRPAMHRFVYAAAFATLILVDQPLPEGEIGVQYIGGRSRFMGF